LVIGVSIFRFAIVLLFVLLITAATDDDAADDAADAATRGGRVGVSEGVSARIGFCPTEILGGEPSATYNLS